MTTITADSVSEIKLRALAAKNGGAREYAKAVHDLDIQEYQEAWDYALAHENRLVIICPPDTYKSTTIQHWIEKKIGEDHNIRILWLMNAGEQTQKRVMAIQETIEQNNVYKEAFGVIPNYDAGWTKTAFFVKRDRRSPDPTLMGCGFGGPFQGLHFDIIIIDDPTNQEDVSSPTTMERQRLKLRGVILDRLVEGGRIVGIFTRWGEEDLLPTFKEIGFRVVTMPIIGKYPWGPTLSNDRFPMDRCMAIRHDKTEAIFDLTYMCNPRAVEGGIIRREQIKYWYPSYKSAGGGWVNGNLPESGTITLCAVDPAASTRNWADPTGIGVGVLELKTRKLYITDLIRKRMELWEVEAELYRIAQHSANLMAVGLETVGFQLSWFQKMKRENRLPIRELPYRSKKQTQSKALGLDRDKTGRAVMVAKGFNDGQILLPEKPDARGEYHGTGPADLPLLDGVGVESELTAFPFGAHDESVDVIAFLRAMADTYQPAKLRVRIGRR